jgi:hypothetical protein
VGASLISRDGDADNRNVRERCVTFVVAAGAVVVLAWASGGYFPSEWGLVALGFLLVLLATIVLSDGVEIGRLGVVLLGALGALGTWQLLSLWWSSSPSLPVNEAERTFLYLAATATLILCLRASTVPALLGGIAAGATVVSVYALGTRLAPGTIGGAYDPSSGYQLAKPIGYWNALGLLDVSGLLIVTGIALRRSAAQASIAAAAAVPLGVCLYFTYSRGSLLALATGLVAVVVLTPSRLRAAALAVAIMMPPLVGVALASRSNALTAAGATLQTAQEEGHRLAWELVGLAIVAVALQLAVARLGPRVRLSLRARRVLAIGTVAAVLLAGVAAAQHVGGPGAIVDRGRAAFVAEPPTTTTGLDRRLLSASGNGRSAYWRVAAGMVEHRPLLGEGAGSFTRTWLRERPVANEARDAHNLYLETLAELGPIGLGLLLLVLAAPFRAVPRVWRDPSAPVAVGVLSAFLIHAAVDWDWEIPLLTLIALACAAVLLVLDPARSRLALTASRRVAGCGAVGVAIVAALVIHVGNRAAADALDALAADRPEQAAAGAERARTWMPWSSEGSQLLGEALAESGDDVGARRALRDAARRDPGEWSIWYDLATVETAARRVNAITRTRELNPLSVELPTLEAEAAIDSS